MRILIAEDASASRRMLAASQRAQKHFVASAIDGTEAWVLLEKDPFNILISHVRMPELERRRGGPHGR